MKKLIGIISSLLFVATVSAKAEVGVGIAGAIHKVMAGTEILRDGGGHANKSMMNNLRFRKYLSKNSR